MKEKIMPIDHCRISIEARPLRELFSKYSPPDTSGPLQTIRPLGRVRRPRRTSASGQSPNKPHLPCVLTGGDNKNRANRHTDTFHHRVTLPDAYQSDSVVGSSTCSSEITMGRNQDTDKCRTDKPGDQHAAVGDSLESMKGKDYQFPSLSRSQAFEQRYKIAASRGGHFKDHQLAAKSQKKDPNKKTIHLPLFRINLRTFSEEAEDSRTVENTRESLRQMMELHKSKLKPASIQNYEFSAIASVGNQTQRSCDMKQHTSALISPAFPAQSILKAPKVKADQRNTLLNKQNELMRGHDQKATRFMENYSSSASENDQNSADMKQSVSDEYDFGPDDEADDSLMSIAIRPNTALTLGSTIHHIDRVVKSPGSDELRELTEAFKNTETQPAWPSYDDIQKMRTQTWSRKSRSRSRNSTSLTAGNMASLEYETQNYNSVFNSTNLSARGRTHYHHHSHHDHAGHRDELTPMLRYTTKQSAYKLDPIIVPSHTCTECPMCNIYQRELEESPCPPNSPIGSPLLETLTQHSQEPIFINSNMNSENGGSKPNSGSRFRRNPRQEVLHVSRIMVSGEVDPSVLDDHSVLTYMKANA